MALDMEMLRKMFYEECRENLDILENILVNLNCEEVDKETIDTVFRAAHSIKGGAATFSLLDISQFTHVVEAYLDKVRNNETTLTAISLDALLKSCDAIHAMLACHESGSEYQDDATADLQRQFESFVKENNEINSESINNDKDAPPPQQIQPITKQPWQISFKPHPTIFYSGNDPLRILRELTEIDHRAKVECEVTDLPELNELDPELCYTQWFISMHGELSEESIREVFDWVEEECELVINQANTENRHNDPSSSENIDDQQIASETSENLTEVPSNQSAIKHSETESTTKQVSARNETNKASSNQGIKAQQKQDVALSSIRVDIDKVDNLINLVGELVITQSMLNEIGNDFDISKLDKLKAGLEQLLQNSKDLQENVLNIRMLPISFAFSRFPRLVRDLSNKLGKDVELEICGEQTELDKTVLERIVDPLVHLVRNGIDHGIETPEARERAGKTSKGHLTLKAYHQGGSIVIEVKDDGHGLDCDKLWQKARDKNVLDANVRRDEMTNKQIMKLIFAPGFSTAEVVSDISGRGVGMDVVRRNIEELGGSIDVDSELGQGSTFTINLPLTLAILDGQLIKVAGEVYVIPLLTIIESIQVQTEHIIHAAGGVELYRLRDENIPIVSLKQEFSLGECDQMTGKILCFVETAGSRIGLLIDELLDQQQVVIKSLESNYHKVIGISGATILGDGSVALILDIQGLVTNFLTKHDERICKNAKGVAA